MKGIALCIFLTATAFASPGVDLSLSTDELQRYFGVNSHEKAPEYEIVYPEVLNADYSKRNVGRSAIAASSLELQIDAFGQTLELALEHDDSSIRPGLVAEYISEEGKITVSVRTDCLYTGTVRGQSTSLVSVSACAGLIAVINHAEGPTYIEPLDEEHAIKRDIGRGLPHIAYKRMPDTGASCPVTSADSFGDEDVDDDKPDDIKTESTRYLELGIVSDYIVYNSRGGNTHNCLTALFNAAKNVMQLNSLDADNTMEPKLVKLTIFTSYQSSLPTGSDSSSNLYAVSSWQNSNNPSSSSAEHWDNAALITGYGMGSTLGRAYVGQCGNYYSSSVTTFSTLAATDVLAHEIGHNLGISHDSDGNGCSSSGYVMGAYVNDHRDEPGWSTCSKSYYNSFVGSRSCYNDA